MEVNDGIEELKTQELPPEHVSEDAPAEDASAVPASEVPAWMRLAYAMEFLLALIATVVLWSEVGGQGHMDLLPWYTKLSCVLAFSWCCVRFTAAMVEQPQTWNRRSIGWFVGIILVGITMAGITFYYHLHEVPDETDSEDTTSASVSWRTHSCVMPHTFPTTEQNRWGGSPDPRRAPSPGLLKFQTKSEWPTRGSAADAGVCPTKVCGNTHECAR